jgi:hypothetical protein
MMDWAKAIETEIAAAYSCHGAILAGDGDGLIAAALRKAKADGMRQAVDIFEHEGGYQLPELMEGLRCRANEIEKGQ